MTIRSTTDGWWRFYLSFALLNDFISLVSLEDGFHAQASSAPTLHHSLSDQIEGGRKTVAVTTNRT